MAFLTDRTFISGLSKSELFHVVNPNDLSQNPAGSSFKANIQQLTDLLAIDYVNITGDTMTGTLYVPTISATTYQNLPIDVYVTGGTYSVDTAVFTNTTGGTFSVSGFTGPFTGGSGNCITDFYVTNIYGCSPITIQSETKFFNNSATGILTFSQGQGSQASGDYSMCQGYEGQSIGDYSHAEGLGTQSQGNYSHSEGRETKSLGLYSHTEGYKSSSIGNFSHAEGGTGVFSGGTSIGLGSHAEGRETIASGDTSHAEGRETISVGLNSHAEGLLTISSGASSHSEGRETTSIGNHSHAEGYSTESIGMYSHAEGENTQSIGIGSHTEGLGTIANGDYQHTQGQYNFTSSTQSAFIIGNGADNSNRSNLVFAAGNEVDIYGDLLVTGTTSADTIVISSTPTTASSLNEVIVRDSSSGELKYYDFTYVNVGLFAQTGSSTPVAATTSEETLIDGGIGNLSIPANFFKPGDSFRLRMGGVVSASNSEVLKVRVKSDSIVLGEDTISFPNTSDRNWMLDIDFTIRTIGGAGVASIVCNGFFNFNNTSDILGGGFVTIENTNFDTTIDNTLDVTAEWGSNDSGNSIYSTNFVLTKTF